MAVLIDLNPSENETKIKVGDNNKTITIETDKLQDLKEVKGLRYNKDKLLSDLDPIFAMEEFRRVLHYGANKYTIVDERGNILLNGRDNWRNGMPWREIESSLQRHLMAWRRGEDFDYDPNCEGCQSGECQRHSGCLHMAHVMVNAGMLTEAYVINPQGDNRIDMYRTYPKIGLDIDEVLADWVSAWRKRWKIIDVPKSWYFDRLIIDRFKRMEDNGELDEFYLNLNPLVNPKEIPFEPHCYITSRPCSVEATTKWLDKHGFSARPVYSIPVRESKVEVAREAGIEMFVDDRFDNFMEMNMGGIFTYLWDAPHNKRHEVSYKRISKFTEINSPDHFRKYYQNAKPKVQSA